MSRGSLRHISAQVFRVVCHFVQAPWKPIATALMPRSSSSARRTSAWTISPLSYCQPSSSSSTPQSPDLVLPLPLFPQCLCVAGGSRLALQPY
ncbi:hypothetical protein DPMN_079594 [Dreissena polymorpha]|uniref:Uncharacterized protein n=1 Tax=Dreissena polymorpha TaxID=45954 RepID=A0A9D4BR49_DREPO|nr:hypothetical protein DPMN_079594 [Dreissena polymorpha]